MNLTRLQAHVERRPQERGSAVVEFVFISALTFAVFLATLQVAFALHTRNTLALAAAEGARHGARADAAPGDAERRAREVLSGATSGSVSVTVSTHLEAPGGVPVVVVEASAPMPALGPLGVGRVLTARGRAVQEGAP